MEWRHRVREGRDDQFDAEVTRHMEARLRIASALVGIADAEDAVQEAVLRAWKAWPSLRERASARAWLLSITVNLCRDWHRGRFGTRRRLDEPFHEHEDESGRASAGLDPGSSGIAARLDLRQAVNALEPELRMVVALRHYVGMDSVEIGALLGISPVTVRTRLHRALGQLRERLSGPDDSEHSRSESGMKEGR
jgi:RNA polymerase sigma factor (sigma-70 family)